MAFAARAGAQEQPLVDPDARPTPAKPPREPNASTASPTASSTTLRAGEMQGVEFGVFLGIHGFSADSTLGRVVLTDPLSGEIVSTNTTPDTGIPLGLRVGFRLDPRFAIELELEAQAVRTRDNLRGGAVFGYRGLVSYRLAGAASQFRPFVLAGVGGQSSILARNTDSDLDSAFTGVVGGGLQLAFTREWALRLDLRGLVGAGHDAPVSADVEVLVGFCYSKSGACGWEERGFLDEHRVGDGGPPQRDSDGDGVFGDADHCPMTPEDQDGVDDDDGCPDLDDDHDEVLEPGDRCPHDAENLNGFEDDDGCPEALPDGLASFEGVVPELRFTVGTPEFQDSTGPALDRLVAGLGEHGELRVKIVVHTARNMADAKLQKLSDDRAGALRAYLVARGVAEDRIEAIGVGADTPLADDNTAEGRARNERVEIHFVPKD
jgi:outer membrane protein OmpA-like peptidoglycan-associated protein